MNQKRAFIFFSFFEFPRESSRDRRGDFPGRPQPGPTLGPGVRVRGECRLSPKTQVSLVRMRPRELSGYHKDEPSCSSSYIRALRVRVTGLERWQGPTPRFTHEVTFTSRHHPYDVITPDATPSHDVITPMTSSPLTLHPFDMNLTAKFDWQVTWSRSARWLVNLYHVT